MKGTERSKVGSSVSVMRVEWIEVWTLLPVRYTVYHHSLTQQVEIDPQHTTQLKNSYGKVRELQKMIYTTHSRYNKLNKVRCNVKRRSTSGTVQCHKKPLLDTP
jgi:hypothetical protein